MAEVKIKKGTVNIKTDRSDLLEVVETADGMTFSFKGGLQLYITDTYMPTFYKQQIAQSINRFEKATISIDFDNVRKPISVEL